MVFHTLAKKNFASQLCVYYFAYSTTLIVIGIITILIVGATAPSEIDIQNIPNTGDTDSLDVWG